ITRWGICGSSSMELFDTPSIRNSGLPSFHPSGAEFLVLAEADALRHCAFPHGNIIRSFDSGSVLGGASELAIETLGDCTFFVSDTTALVSTSEGGLFLLNLVAEECASELILVPNRADESIPLPVFDLTLSY